MNRVYDLHRLNGFYILNTKPVLKFSGLKKYYSTGSIEKDSFEYVTYENRPSRANLQPEEGCLIFAKMSNTTKTIYIDNELKENIYSTGFFSIKPKNINYEYLFYLLECTEFLQEKDSYSNGTTQFSINENNLKKIKVHLTTFKDEQTRIVKAIKAKEEKINALITNEEKQIEKLKAYKQALISEVVTKGLDPNIPMKDSGVDWIGKINLNYSLYKLKYLLSEPLLYGANEVGLKNGDFRYIRITDITLDNKLKSSNDNQYLNEIDADPFILKDGDVLFARSGATCGKSFVYHDYYGPSCFAGYLIRARFRYNLIMPEYVGYFSMSSIYDLWKNQIFIQATIQNISANKYAYLDMIVPSIKEQHEIVTYLDQKVTLLDKVIKCHLNKIEKLKAYRKSMIYEYVTGKRKVY